MKIILLLLTFLELTGCAGYATYGDFETQERFDASGRGEKGLKLDLAYAKRRLGKPTQINKIDANTEELVYEFGYRWKGITLYLLIIPIPLRLPLGKDRLTIRVKKNGEAHYKAIKDVRTAGIYCGVIPKDWFVTIGCRDLEERDSRLMKNLVNRRLESY